MTNIFDRSSPPEQAARRQSATSPGRTAPRFQSNPQPPGEVAASRSPKATVISDRPRLAADMRALLHALHYEVEAIAGPERPWHHAAEREEALVIVDVPGVPVPDDGLDFSRCIAVRPPGAGPDFDQRAAALGLRGIVGRRHTVDELISMLGDPDSTAPDTAETLQGLTDAEIGQALDPEPAEVHWDDEIAAGRRVDDRYLLVLPLSEPPRERWRAFDERLLADVEIELRAESASSKHTRRFLETSRRAQRLSHPNIVAHVGAGQWNGHLYAATELVGGITLRERLDAAGGPLSPAVAARIGRQIASALDVAHRRDLAYRGLAPERVRVLAGDSIRLTDFAGLHAPDGLVTGTRDLLELTVAGYLPPERLSGSASDAFAADAWALGVLLYEMVAGFPPFQASGLVAMREAVRAACPPPLRAANPAAPEGLALAVAALLSADPAARPTDLRAVAAGLFAVEAAGQKLAWTPPAEA